MYITIMSGQGSGLTGQAIYLRPVRPVGIWQPCITVLCLRD